MIIVWTTAMYDYLVTPGAPFIAHSPAGSESGGATTSTIAVINMFRYYSASR